MRKELPGAYIEQDNGNWGVKARTPEGKVTEYEIGKRDLAFDIHYIDSQGTTHKARAMLRPVVAQILRVDKILPSDLHLFYLAAMNCYSGLSTPELITKAQNATEDEINKFLNENIIETGHWSVIEHRGPSFLIEGISRACSHQFVRHRLLTYSQQSQRYLDFAPKRGKEEIVFPFIISPSIRWQPDKVKMFLKGIRTAVAGYYGLRVDGVYPEDARLLFPNATATRIVASGNPRVWLEIIPKRTCARAQWEIDMMITEIAHQLWQEMPAIFKKAGPVCSLGKCDQGKKACGVPLNKPLSAFFNDLKYPHDQLIFGMR